MKEIRRKLAHTRSATLIYYQYLYLHTLLSFLLQHDQRWTTSMIQHDHRWTTTTQLAQQQLNLLLRKANAFVEMITFLLIYSRALLQQLFSSPKSTVLFPPIYKHAVIFNILNTYFFLYFSSLPASVHFFLPPWSDNSWKNCSHLLSLILFLSLFCDYFLYYGLLFLTLLCWFFLFSPVL